MYMENVVRWGDSMVMIVSGIALNNNSRVAMTVMLYHYDYLHVTSVPPVDDIASCRDIIAH